jgi:hypothetical protein
MPLPLELVRTLQHSDPKDAWAAILAYAWEVCSQPISPGKAESDVVNRDRRIGDIDHYLATAAWDLWTTYEASVNRTSESLVQWWHATGPGRGVLLLDGLSLREVPWLLGQAKERGFTIHQTGPTCAELPPDTTPFAKSLGFGQRSSLGNNCAGASHRLSGARTESVDMAWANCADLIGSEPDWVFWHHWPDHRLHVHDDPGKGLASLTDEAETHLTGDDFWSLASRLAHGRRLIITSDHGYAASGLWTDANQEQSEYLKKMFKSGRWYEGHQRAGAWMPPIDLSIQSANGTYLYVNGRRKWKSAGGYPTLTHGGLTVLEVAVPFIEMSRSL